MRRFRIHLRCLLLSALAGFSVAPANACQLTCDAPPDPDVAGYRVYGAPPPTIQALGMSTTYDCGPESDGQVHTFTVSAVDTSGNESPQTPPVSKLFAQLTTPPVETPMIRVSPSPVTLTGTVGLGTVTKDVTVTNTGTGALVFTWNDSIPWFHAGHPSDTLAAGASKTFTVTAK